MGDAFRRGGNIPRNRNIRGIRVVGRRHADRRSGFGCSRFLHDAVHFNICELSLPRRRTGIGSLAGVRDAHRRFPAQLAFGFRWGFHAACTTSRSAQRPVVAYERRTTNNGEA